MRYLITGVIVSAARPTLMVTTAQRNTHDTIELTAAEHSTARHGKAQYSIAQYDSNIRDEGDDIAGRADTADRDIAETTEMTEITEGTQ